MADRITNYLPRRRSLRSNSSLTKHKDARARSSSPPPKSQASSPAVCLPSPASSTRVNRASKRKRVSPSPQKKIRGKKQRQTRSTRQSTVMASKKKGQKSKAVVLEDEERKEESEKTPISQALFPTPPSSPGTREKATRTVADPKIIEDVECDNDTITHKNTEDEAGANDEVEGGSNPPTPMQASFDQLQSQFMARSSKQKQKRSMGGRGGVVAAQLRVGRGSRGSRLLALIAPSSSSVLSSSSSSSVSASTSSSLSASSTGRQGSSGTGSSVYARLKQASSLPSQQYSGLVTSSSSSSSSSSLMPPPTVPPSSSSSSLYTSRSVSLQQASGHLVTNDFIPAAPVASAASTSTSTSASTPNLPLPIDYQRLLEFFNALETAMSVYLRRGKNYALFDELCTPIQSMCRRKFTLTHLGQIMHLFPRGYAVSTMRVARRGQFDRKLVEKLKITWTPVLRVKQEGGGCGGDGAGGDSWGMGGDGEGKTKKMSSVSNAVVLERRHMFYTALVNIVHKHHSHFLARAALPSSSSSSPSSSPSSSSLSSSSPPLSTLRGWDARFCLDSVPGVPCSEVIAPKVAKEKQASTIDQLMKHQRKLELSQTPAAIAAARAKAQAAVDAKPMCEAVRRLDPSILRRAQEADIKRHMLAQFGVNESEQKISMLSRLPKLITVIRTCLVSARRSAMPAQEMVALITTRNRQYPDAGDVRRLLKELAELFPAWCHFKMVGKHNPREIFKVNIKTNPAALFQKLRELKLCEESRIYAPSTPDTVSPSTPAKQKKTTAAAAAAAALPLSSSSSSVSSDTSITGLRRSNQRLSVESQAQKRRRKLLGKLPTSKAKRSLNFR